MRPINLVAAAAALILSSSAIIAAPMMSPEQGVTGTNVIQVHDTCHQNNRTHGGSYPSHFHDPGTCQVIWTGGGGNHCHGNSQHHSHPGYGSLWHSHSGNNCGVVQNYQNYPQNDNCVTLGAPGAFSFQFCD